MHFLHIANSDKPVTAYSALIKKLGDFRCQICNHRIEKKNGGFYVEAAHITAKHKGGQGTMANIMLLCPNHHKEVDFGSVNIIARQNNQLILLNGKEYTIEMP